MIFGQFLHLFHIDQLDLVSMTFYRSILSTSPLLHWLDDTYPTLPPPHPIKSDQISFEDNL